MSEELRARLDTYNDVRARLQRLLSTSGPDHPQVAGLRRTLATTAERLFVELEAMRAEHDVVLVDLPRGAPPPPGAGVLIVTGLDLRSAVAAQALSGRYGEPEALTARGTGAERLGLVLRDGSHDVDDADLVTMTGADVVARLPTDRSVPQHAGRGDDPTRGRGGARRCARALAALLAGEHEAAARRGPGDDGVSRGRP